MVCSGVGTASIFSIHTVEISMVKKFVIVMQFYYDKVGLSKQMSISKTLMLVLVYDQPTVKFSLHVLIALQKMFQKLQLVKT